MEIYLSEENRRFRTEVVEFLVTAIPADIAQTFQGMQRHTSEQINRWHRILAKKGWIAPHWPTAYGGAGWPPMQQYVFEVEAAMRGAPRLSPFSLKMIGPVLMKFGTEDQKRRFLPPILSGDHGWCQGFSEPGAGSDLASLKTRAERTNHGYRINGSKIWTTLAHEADFMFALVRTDPTAPKRQSGISMLLVDMKTPGVDVRPIITIDGIHHVNEVFFEDVEVPAENLVGEENNGWTVAKSLLANERVSIAQVGLSKARLSLVKAHAARAMRDGHAVIDDPVFAVRLADLETDLLALEVTNLRMLNRLQAGGDVSALVPFLKLRGSQVQQAIGELAVEVAGPDAVMWDPAVTTDEDRFGMFTWLQSRAATIYGGSSEVMKNIVAKQLLGYA